MGKLDRVFWVHLDDHDLDYLDLIVADEDAANRLLTDPDPDVDMARLIAKVWLGAAGKNGLAMTRGGRKIGLIGAVMLIIAAWFAIYGAVMFAYWLIGVL